MPRQWLNYTVISKVYLEPHTPWVHLVAPLNRPPPFSSYWHREPRLSGFMSSRPTLNSVAGCHQPQIWWSNAIFFVSIHLAAAIGIYYFPPWATQKKTLLLWFLTWQLSDFGSVSSRHFNGQFFLIKPFLVSQLDTIDSTLTKHFAPSFPFALSLHFWGPPHSRDLSRFVQLMFF